MPILIVALYEEVFSMEAGDGAERLSVKRLMRLTVVIDLGLGIGKVLIGWLANSHALIADGIHSLSDLLTDVMVLLLTTIGRQAPDPEHPYGHARFETFGTVVMGSVLISVALLLAWDSCVRLWYPEVMTTPGGVALIAAAASIFIKEVLYQYTNKVGEAHGSPLIIANAWHHRSDSLSSVVVLIGVAGAMVGFPWFESLAALCVALMIAQIGWRLARSSVKQLVDTAVSVEESHVMQEAIANMTDVRGVHSMRTRLMGNQVLLDIHIQVNPHISVSEGHQIGEWVTRSLYTQHPEIGDIIYHIDAEDDFAYETAESRQPLAPLRQEIHEMLAKVWPESPDISQMQNFTLHYLDNKVRIDVCMDLALIDDREHDRAGFKADLIRACANLDWIEAINISYG